MSTLSMSAALTCVADAEGWIALSNATAPVTIAADALVPKNVCVYPPPTDVVVIPKPGEAPDLAGLRDWANQRLAAPQRLHAVELREDFPRNALGKVLKRILREPYWAGRGTSI